MQAMTSAAGQAIGRQCKNTTAPMFSTRLNTAITAGRTYKTLGPASSPIQNTGLFASVVTAGRPHRAEHRSAPAARIYLRPRRVIAAHDQRPSHVRDGLAVLVAGVRVLWCGRAVLAADDLLGLVAGGGQPPCLGQAALTWRVIAGQQLSQFGG
jgi:hypothetical protein